MNFVPFLSKDFGQIVKTPIWAFNKVLALRPAFAEEEEFQRGLIL